MTEGYCSATWNNASGSVTDDRIELASAATAFWILAHTHGGTAPDCFAIIFEHCDYGGWSLGLSKGDYTTDDLRRFGIPDNVISSLIVADESVLTLYGSDHFTGWPL